jgi:hypothetical protein
VGQERALNYPINVRLTSLYNDQVTATLQSNNPGATVDANGQFPTPSQGNSLTHSLTHSLTTKNKETVLISFIIREIDLKVNRQLPIQSFC